MDVAFLKNNWALLLAALIAALLAPVFVMHLIRRSAWGQLRKTLNTLAAARQHEAKALKSVAKTERIARRLHAQADRAKPRHVQEAKEALEDARALAKIANDKVLIAENHVRRVIHEEYPPVRQGRLRNKYLPEHASDKRPFSF